jgi:hypothetical protein
MCRIRGEILWLVYKIFVFEDIRRRPDQPEADLFAALVAGREGVATMHQNVVCRTMLAVVNDFVDSAFRDRLPGEICLIISAAAAQPSWSSAAMLKYQPGSRPGISADILCSAHECRILLVIFQQSN